MRVSAHNPKVFFEEMEDIFKSYQPDREFIGTYLADDLQYNYSEEMRMGDLLDTTALVGAVIACLGMFGLALFERRVKEVGIRRVLGASARQVIGRLLRELSVPVIIAALVAVPVSYRIGQTLLEPFAYRVTLDVWVFFVGGAIALVLANLTAMSQVLRVTRANPVEALRAE